MNNEKKTAADCKKIIIEYSDNVVTKIINEIDNIINSFVSDGIYKFKYKINNDIKLNSNIVNRVNKEYQDRGFLPIYDSEERCFNVSILIE